MEEYESFKNEFMDKYSAKEFEDCDKLIGKCLEAGSSEDFTGEVWSASLDVEKIHQLQYTYYIALSKSIADSDDEEVNVVFENGINNGTAMLEYCLEGGLGVPCFKKESILHDIEPDFEAMQKALKKGTVNKYHAKQYFEYHKKNILKMYKNQNYDNYVTGGGTTVLDNAYLEQKEKYHKMGLYWKLIYKDIEVDVNLV